MEKTEQAFKWMVNIFRKNNIPYILVGGFAAGLYGSPRELRDIDFDVPSDKIKEIVPDVFEYIVFGPRRFVSDVFDLELLRLNYQGQKIDIGGGTGAKIYDRKSKAWIEDATDFSSYKEMKVFGEMIPVIKPEDLIGYKSKSPRKEDLMDIEAVKKFISKRL